MCIVMLADGQICELETWVERLYRQDGDTLGLPVFSSSLGRTQCFVK